MARTEVSFRLNGQVAMVVGATGGIGEAVSLALTRAGAAVAVVDLDPEKVEALPPFGRPALEAAA